MQDITGYGVAINLVASNTFPTGLQISQLADDADVLDMPSIKIGETAMGVNGDLVKWARAVTNPVVISVIAGSQDDINLGILANANRVSQGQTSARDVITLTVVYPDGTTNTFSNGAITDAMFGKSISSAGRLKTKAYAFSFQNSIGS